MTSWILKTEPSTYSFDDLMRDGKTRWDGVKNPVALKNLRAMKKDDLLYIYHTGDEKQIVGLASVASSPYDDPGNPSLTVVDIVALRVIHQPVRLSDIKKDRRMADFALVRQARLSVVPVPTNIEQILLNMAGEK